MKPTDEQQKIIDHKRGPANVIAGPGTGKTNTICCRVNALIKHKISSQKILLLTFSNSAALNMSSRLKERFNIDNVQCSTTHAFGLSIIMNYWPDLNFSAQPTVQIKPLNKSLNFIIKKVAAKNKVDAKQLSAAVSTAKKNGNPCKTKNQQSVTEVLNRYQAIKQKKEWLDYPDMINLSIQLLKKPHILKKVVAKIDHLLVDEVQDMTMKEYQLLYYLAKHTKSAVFVGDIKQNIYEFKGANPKGLAKLERYLKPTLYHLTQSFRVLIQMLPLVNAIGQDIVNNAPKLTSSQQGFKPDFFKSANSDEQADFVVGRIKKLLKKGVQPEEIAILGRTKRPLILFKNALIEHGIEATETYCGSKGMPIELLKSLIRIVKWQAGSTSKPIHSLTRVLEYTGLTQKRQQKLHKAVCDKGWGCLHVPKEYSETHYLPIRS